MKHLSVLLSSVLLVACGGGGGGGPVASTSTFQLKQAYTNDFNNTAPYNFSVSGVITVNGISGSLSGSGSVTQSPVSSTTFEGVPAQQKSKTVAGTITVTAGGIPASSALPTTIGTTFLSPGFDLVGFTSVGAYSVAAAPVTTPVTGRVGNSGTIGTFNTYASIARGLLLSTTVFTWTLSADTADTALFTLTQTVRNSSNAVLATQDEVFRVTPAGGATRISASSVVSGLGTLTFNY